MDAFYQAMLTRDRRFDGRFFVGVRTTGIYCRPICPARKPLLKNVLFFSTATAAEAAGFRPCLRCRPETAPGSPAWEGTSTTVARAVRLMSQPDLQETGVQGLSERLGLSERRLHQLFMEHLGAPPGQVWQQSRLDFARQLLDETRMTVTQIALQSGFQSIRAFNSAFKIRFMSTPTQLRRERVSKPEGELSLRLPYRPPFPWELLLEFLKGRAAPGVEAVIGKSYRRTIRIGKVSGWIEVSPEPGQMALRVRVVSRHKISEFPFMEINARFETFIRFSGRSFGGSRAFQDGRSLGACRQKDSWTAGARRLGRI